MRGRLGWVALVVAGGVLGCSSSDDGGGAACGGDSPRELEPALRDTKVVVAGSSVYVGGPSSEELARIPLDGSAKDVVDADGHVAVLAASDSGLVVWQRSRGTVTSNAIFARDRAGAKRVVPLPDDVTATDALVIDAADHVFGLSHGTGSFPLLVWRWDPSRDAVDVLYRARDGIAGPWRDGAGVAWAGPADAGTLTLYHEDAEGGAPRVGPALPNDAEPIGVDERAVYAVKNGGAAGRMTIDAIDRASGGSSVALEVDGTSYTPVFAVDDGSFYWLVPRSSGGTLSRADKSATDRSAAAAELAPSVDVASFAVGGCTVAWVGQRSDGTWAVFARAK